MLACGLIVVLIAAKGRVSPPAAAAVLVAAALAGLYVGQARLEAIDGDAVTVAGPPEPSALAGFVEAEPKRSRGTIRFPFRTVRGRVMVEAADPGVGGLPAAGDGLTVEGSLGPPPGWYRPVTARQGLELMLRAKRIRPDGERRGGLTGLIDGMRQRAERGLTRGMGDREAALAKGFVLGQDAAIDDRTTEDFQNSGLAHLLAVSGQNVVLLGLLAMPILALLGAGPQARLIWTGLLILIYIPLAGGDPSIQRAGVMGLAGLTAAMAGRATSRAWALGLAGAVTLGLDPRATADIGWQLSFTAVIGIALLAGPFRDRLEGVTGPGRWQRALADGIAVTLAATIATAPLVAFHFERLPVGTVAANVAALPAVAPSMWLGMIGAALGQVWSGLALPFNLLNAVLLAYIAQVATWLGRPSWAVLEIELGIPGTVAATIALGLITGLILWVWKRPPEDPTGIELRRRRRRTAVATVLILALCLAAGPDLFGHDRRELAPPPAGGARIEILDVGQGDAILIRPSGSDPLLIDGGPPGGDLTGALRSAGVDRLGAVILTHPDLDHFGGLYELFAAVEVERFLFDAAPGKLAAAARSAGARPVRVAEGQRLHLGGGVTLDLLWPPPKAEGTATVEDANARSVAGLLKWKRFRMYLPGDGEAESIPVDPGPLDVLKVAHHGSEDGGLPALLDHSRPRLAVIPVGDGNTFGHPTRQALDALSSVGARVLRTDRDGTVSIVLEGSTYRVETGR